VVTLSRRTLWLGGAAGLVVGCGGMAAWYLTRAVAPPPGLLPEMALGAPTAPVTLIEYGSPSCPHCARFAADTLPLLKERYIDSGQLRFIYREFALNSLDVGAVMTLRCVTPDRYFVLLGSLHRTQDGWAAAQNKDEFAARLATLAGETGLDRDGFDRCIGDQALYDRVLAARSLASSYGVESTPTFYVNGRKATGYKSLAQLSAIIDPLLMG
jgi:protein-disulfide isomerase